MSSLILLIVGCASGVFAYHLTQVADANPIVIIPSVVAATIGAANITTSESPRK